MSDSSLWKCECGNENSSNFCIYCGKKREEGEVIEKKDVAPSVAASSIAAAASVGKVEIPDDLKANIQKQAEPVQPVFQPQPQPQMQQPYQPVQQAPMMQQPQPQQQQMYVPQPQQTVQPQYQQQYQPQYTAPVQTGNVGGDEEMDRRKKISNKFSLISLLCHLGYFFGVFVVGVIEYMLENGSGSDSALGIQIGSSLVGTLFTASIVFMIIARVKCKKATFAKVLMIVYIVEIALLVIAVVAFIVLMFYAIITCGL